MEDKYPGALGLSRTVLGGVRVLNVLYGIGILAMLVVSIANPDWLYRALKVEQETGWTSVAIGMRGIMVIGIVGAVITHRVLTTLIQMVDTVRAGDPFVRDNASRLQAIAWLVLAAEVLHLLVGAIERWVSTPQQPIDLRLSYSFTPWVIVLMLFVLARVFDHGARMREDIEGTI